MSTIHSLVKCHPGGYAWTRLLLGLSKQKNHGRTAPSVDHLESESPSVSASCGWPTLFLGGRGDGTHKTRGRLHLWRILRAIGTIPSMRFPVDRRAPAIVHRRTLS